MAGGGFVDAMSGGMNGMTTGAIGGAVAGGIGGGIKCFVIYKCFVKYNSLCDDTGRSDT